MLPDSSVRLNKYISESGICSRREADRYIEQGNVFLNQYHFFSVLLQYRI